jgi:hypothetical protein
MARLASQINSSLWVIDESKFGLTTESAIIYNTTLIGSHHGVAIPVDDNHVLHSLATPERINRTSDSSSLPDTFQVVDYEGNVLHSIADTTSGDTSCSGFHGEWAVNNTFVLACDAEHGGILVVDYEKTSSEYTSRALSYPESFTEHRTGSYAEHHDSPNVVGNFGDDEAFYLMAFKPTDSQLTESNVMPLDASECDFNFEQSEGEIVLTFMPDGMLHAFEFESPFTEIAKVQIVEDMVTCSEAIFVPGFVQAFVMHPSTQMLYSIDLHEVHEGKMVVTTTKLGFTPFAAVVGGVPQGAACTFDETDHDHDQNDGGTSDAGSFMTTASTAIVLAGVMLIGW